MSHVSCGFKQAITTHLLHNIIRRHVVSDPFRHSRLHISTAQKRSTQRLWSARAADESSEDEDGHDVGKNLDELNGDRLTSPKNNALQPNLHRFGKTEKETRQRGPYGVPFPENERSERHETTTCGHAARK